MASKHDGAASYSNIVTISESSVVPGVHLGRHQRRQRPGEPRRRHYLEERRRQGSGRAEGNARVARRSVALRCGHRATSRSTAHRTDDHKPYVFMTTDFGETWTSIAGQPAGGQRQRDPRGSEEPRTCSTSAPSTRSTSRSNGGKEWKRFMNGLPDRAHRRHPGAPARQRPHRRHPRPQHLDHGRHHGAAADDRPTAAERGCGAVRHPPGDRVGDGHPEGDPGRRGRRSSAAQNPARGSAISYWLKAEPAE